jgi:hypothetical protein
MKCAESPVFNAIFFSAGFLSPVPYKESDNSVLTGAILHTHCLCAQYYIHAAHVRNMRYTLLVCAKIETHCLCVQYQIYTAHVRNIRLRIHTTWEHAVAQLVEALRYKPEGRGFEFVIDLILSGRFSL